MVFMRHPRLPEDQLIKAMPQQVQAYQHSGWEVVDDPPSEPDTPPDDQQDTNEAPAEDAGASAFPDSEQSPRRRRVTTTEGDR